MARRDDSARVQLAELIGQKASGPQIAQAMGVTRQRVHQLRKAMDLPPLLVWRSVKRKQRLALLPQLLDAGLSAEDIARFAGLSVSTLRCECAALGCSTQMKRNGKARRANPDHRQLLARLLILPLEAVDIARLLDIPLEQVPVIAAPVTVSPNQR
jgi:hypothetical protein